MRRGTSGSFSIEAKRRRNRYDVPGEPSGARAMKERSPAGGGASVRLPAKGLPRTVGEPSAHGVRRNGRCTHDQSGQGMNASDHFVRPYD